MKRPYYYNYILSRLSTFATEIELRGKLNLLDSHLHSENFYLHFLNKLFGWQLQNLNSNKSNVAAFDLIDITNKFVVQISATATKAKVESALSKDLSAYAGYSFKFVSIAKDASPLRSKTFYNPHNLSFTPLTDIYDIHYILSHIASLGVNSQRQIYNFIKEELGTAVDPSRLESNLAAVINILAREDLNQDHCVDYPVPFAIAEKITYNDLKLARIIIDDYDIHYGRVARIYGEFDKSGCNKSLSVLEAIRHEYRSHKESVDNDSLFFKVIECVSERVQNSANFAPLPAEELELCVNILVVDAFIRCKIFENPEGYVHATS